MATKERILVLVEDLVADFLYYGRKEDEDVPRGAIEEAVESGTVTADEIAGKFREALEAGLAGG